MAKKQQLSIITANHLLEGDVIYMKADGSWSRSIKDAASAIEPSEIDALLNIAKAQLDVVVGAYAMPVKLDEDGKPEPTHFRETFRTKGPSNYFHGKQVDQQSALEAGQKAAQKAGQKAAQKAVGN